MYYDKNLFNIIYVIMSKLIICGATIGHNLAVASSCFFGVSFTFNVCFGGGGGGVVDY